MSLIGLIALIVGLIVIGVILHFVRASDKIDAGFKKIIYAVVVILVLIFLLQVLGVWSELKTFRL